MSSFLRGRGAFYTLDLVLMLIPPWNPNCKHRQSRAIIRFRLKNEGDLRRWIKNTRAR